MKNKKIIGAMVATALVVGAGGAWADNENKETRRERTDQTGRTEQNRDVTDTEHRAMSPDAFLKAAAQSGMAEVNMAQIGTQRAENPELKEISQKLVRDHSKLNDEVKELAQKKNITLDTEVDAKHRKMIDHISGLSGAEFDHAYTQHMIEGHKKSIAKFQQAAANTEDDEVMKLAKSNLPTLKKHLAMLEKCAAAHTAGATVNEAAGAKVGPEGDDKLSNEATKKVDQYQPPK